MSHFQTRVKNFLPSGKISFPAALSDVASSLARTALCAFSIPPSSIFPQKNLWFCSILTDCSINTPEKQAKFPEYFFAAFPFAFLLSSPNMGCTSLAAEKQFFQQKGRPYTRLVPPMPEQGIDGIFFCLGGEGIQAERLPGAAGTGIAATKKGILLQATARPKDPPCSQLSRSLSCKAFQSSHHLFHVLDR